MKNTEVAKIAKKITKKAMIPAYITPAAVNYSEAYAREHKDIINQMQKARGHIYNSGVELIAAVYTIQNGGVTA